MDRIKKFFKDNEELCIHLATATVITTVNVVLTKRVINGMKVVAVFDDSIDTTTQRITIIQRNGTSDGWSRQIEPAA